MRGLPQNHTLWWRRDCPLRNYTFVSGGVLRVHSSELQRKGVAEWLESMGLRYVRVAVRPWEESLRNPTTGTFLEVLGIWSQEAWPLGSPHAQALIGRYS